MLAPLTELRLERRRPSLYDQHLAQNILLLPVPTYLPTTLMFAVHVLSGITAALR